MGNSVARVNGGAYKILGTLGEGGSSTVYEVRRGSDKRHFALKWVRGVRDADTLERLLLEIQVHKRLGQQYANILPLVESEVRVSDEETKPAHSNGHGGGGGTGNGDGRMRLDMGSQRTKEVLMLFPICQHGSLQTMLEDAFQKEGCSPFSERECLRFFSELLDAVKQVHDMGFAHRDLKPGNVLISSTNPVQPMLMDFGSIAPISTHIWNAMDHNALCEEAENLSSAPYRPPELWTSNGYTPNSVIDGRTDVWQLGCTLYAMAFGPYSPFENAKEGVLHLAILNGNVRFPQKSSHGEQFSSAFTSLVKWMLIPDIASRPTLDEVREQLQQIRAGAYDPAARVMNSYSRCRSTNNSRHTSQYQSSYQAPVGPLSSPPPSIPQPPQTQILSFSKLASEEWADFAAYEKVSMVDSSVSMHSSEDWGEFTGFERSNSTSVLSMGTLVWSADSTAGGAIGAQQPIPSSDLPRRQSSRRHSLDAPSIRTRHANSSVIISNFNGGGTGDLREHELRRALSTRGRLLLSQALDTRASQ